MLVLCLPRSSNMGFSLHRDDMFHPLPNSTLLVQRCGVGPKPSQFGMLSINLSIGTYRLRKFYEIFNIYEQLQGGLYFFNLVAFGGQKIIRLFCPRCWYFSTNLAPSGGITDGIQK